MSQHFAIHPPHILLPQLDSHLVGIRTRNLHNMELTTKAEVHYVSQSNKNRPNENFRVQKPDINVVFEWGQ